MHACLILSLSLPASAIPILSESCESRLLHPFLSLAASLNCQWSPGIIPACPRPSVSRGNSDVQKSRSDIRHQAHIVTASQSQSTTSSLPSYRTLPSPSPPDLYIVYRTCYTRTSQLRGKVTVVSAHLDRAAAELAAGVIALEDREKGEAIQSYEDNLAEVEEGTLAEISWSTSYTWDLMPVEVGVREVVLS